MADRLINKVAVVTGGALGIGESCCRLLASEGARVVCTDIKETEGRSVVERIEKEGGAALFINHDVASEEDWKRVISETTKAYGKLDVLVNNAGIGLSAPADTETLPQWRRLMSVNLDGVFLGTKYAIPAMVKTGGGSIINISSIEGLIGDPNLAAYNASKGGVRLFTKSAALRCAKAGFNVRVNSVHPGYIWTPMVANYVNATPDPAAARKALEALHPVGHLGEPEDVAYGVLYLASDEAKFITGAELVIDGGYTAQ